MRFVEFKLPEKDSPLFKRIYDELLSMITIAEKLPEENPVRQQASDFIEKLKNQTGIAEADEISMAENDLIVKIAKLLSDKGNTFLLLDIEKQKKALLKEFTKLGQLQQEKGKEQIKSATAEKIAKAKKLAAKIGKDDKWGIELHNKLSYFENEQLHNDFLDVCLANQGIGLNLNSGDEFQKLNLKSIINPKLTDLFSNQDAFEGLASLPLTEGTGQGSGVGPGESLFACLFPNAKKAPKSDLVINGEIYEVKGGKGQESTGWLDATGAKATDLRKAFLSVVDPLLRSKGRTKMNFKDGTQTTLNDIIDNADFRPEKFRELKTIFNLLSSEDQIKTIDAIYKELAPTVKTSAETKKFYNKSVKDTVNLILSVKNQSELGPINRLQAKLSMIEYAIGAYKASNFLIYNYTTQDLVIIRGIAGIEKSIDSSDSNLIATSIRMRGSGATKGSPGIAIKTREVRSRTKQF